MNKSRKLNLPFKEKITLLEAESYSEVIGEINRSKHFTIDFRGLNTSGLRLLVHEGDWVRIGTPICHCKRDSQKLFVSSVSGKIVKIDRGLRRSLERVAILSDGKGEMDKLEPIVVDSLTKETLITHMNRSGAACRFYCRPFKRLADLTKTYDALFVNASKRLPYALPLSYQMKEHKEAIEIALKTLSQFYPLHFVTSEKISLNGNFKTYEVEGTWLTSLTSWHIHKIDPIVSIGKNVLTIDLEDLIYCGYSFLGQWHTTKHVVLTGEAVKKEARGIYKMHASQNVGELVNDKLEGDQVQLISANPLTGHEIQQEGALLPSDNVLTALALKEIKRSLYHMRASFPSFTTTAGYFSTRSNAARNTQLYGDQRPFIAQEFYDKTLPFDLEIVPLIKAILAQDYEKAVFLGLLEVDSEDFALATFVCPCKIEMMQIVREGQTEALKQMLI